MTTTSVVVSKEASKRHCASDTVLDSQFIAEHCQERSFGKWSENSISTKRRSFCVNLNFRAQDQRNSIDIILLSTFLSIWIFALTYSSKSRLISMSLKSLILARKFKHCASISEELWQQLKTGITSLAFVGHGYTIRNQLILKDDFWVHFLSLPGLSQHR